MMPGDGLPGHRARLLGLRWHCHGFELITALTTFVTCGIPGQLQASWRPFQHYFFFEQGRIRHLEERSAM
jgi:hypothetical protein